MIDFTNGQRRAVASGLTVLSVAVVLAFVVLIAWGIVKALAFASPALVPVILGFFLSLFFRPYYLWWRRMVRNPTLALVAMLLTVFVPVGLVVWYAGSLIVDQLVNLIDQGPQLVEQVLHWFRGTFPRLHSLLLQMGIPYEDVGYMYTKYGSTALKAGSGAFKILSGVLSGLVTLIFFVFFLMSKYRRGGEITAHMPFLK
ncbi:MAG: AI-2E family transporter, partial [Kiritimatiellae bacterium]|nr:AI-2E family transporter [Kiritimatiellia bacterium]